MRMKSADLFAYVEAIGQHRNLDRETLLVQGYAVGQLANRLSHAIALLDEARRRALRNPADRLLDDIHALREIRRESAALGRAHFVERSERTFDDCDQFGGASRLFVFFRRHDVRHPQHRADVQVFTHAELLLEPSDLFDVSAKALLVPASGGAVAPVDPSGERDVAATDSLSHRVPDVAFPLAEVRRKLDRRVEEAVV